MSRSTPVSAGESDLGFLVEESVTVLEDVDTGLTDNR